MVAGLTASYEGFNYTTELRAALDSAVVRAKNTPVADTVANIARSLDTTLTRVATAGFGIVHRDLGRRYSDQFIADAMPTPSVVAGVDEPCRQLDASMDTLRNVQATVTALNTTLKRANLPTLPSWTPPAAPACGR